MKRFFSLTLALFSAVSFCMAQGEVYSMNLEKGKTYGMSTESSALVVQNILGQQIDSDVTMGGTVYFSVVGADAEGYDMSVWYGSLYLDISGAAEQSASSADASSGDPASMLLAAISGKKFNMKMNRNGYISSVTGVDALLDSAVSEMMENSASLTPEQAEAVKSSMSQSYNDNAVKGNFQMGQVVFPDHPLSVGDSWSHTGYFESTFGMNIETVFTLAGKSEDGLLITSESTVATSDDDAPADISGMKAKYNLKGTMSAEAKINAVSGWIISGKTAQDISGTIDIMESEMMPNGFKIPISMKTDMETSDLPAAGGN